MRRGLGAGQGRGYKNIIGIDPLIHKQSAMGIKQRQYVMTPARQERQHERHRSHGKYAETNPCEICGKSAGINYWSYPDTGSTGYGLVVCKRCYLKNYEKGIATSVQAQEAGLFNKSDTMQHQESKIVSITLNGETRNVEIERMGQGYAWHAKGKPIIAIFKTGAKNHAPTFCHVIEKDGKFFFASQIIHNKRAMPSRWNDKIENSKWTSQDKAEPMEHSTAKLERIHWALYETEADAKKDLAELREAGHEVELRKTDKDGFKFAIYIKKDWHGGKAEPMEHDNGVFDVFMQDVDFAHTTKEASYDEVDGEVQKQHGTSTRAVFGTVVDEFKAKTINTIHNHPSENPPSMNDIFSFLYSGRHHEDRVVLPSGTVYIMVRKPETDTLAFWHKHITDEQTTDPQIINTLNYDKRRAMMMFANTYKRYMDAEVKALGKSVGDMTLPEREREGAILQDKVLRDLADTFRFEVKVEHLAK